MSLFSNFTTENLEQEQDVIYSSLRESDIYPMTIEMAHVVTASSGAMGIRFIFKDESGRKYEETVYISTKEGKNYFVPKQSPETKRPLMGFTIANDICVFATGSPLATQQTEKKIVEQYDPELKKRTNKEAEVLTTLLGAKVQLGIQKILSNKEAMIDGVYQPTDETREFNATNKVFNAEGKTLNELVGEKPAEFKEDWLKANKGKLINRTKKDNTASASSSAPVAVKNLFG